VIARHAVAVAGPTIGHARAPNAQTQISALQDQVAAAQTTIATMQQGLPICPEQIKVLKMLSDLGDQIE